jgi:hypothetical protein
LGFVVATVGLLHDRVRANLLFPLVAVGLAMPLFLQWSTVLYADLLLGYQISLAAVVLIYWLENRSAWQPACATLLLGSALLTKREGVLVAACVLFACGVASWRERKWSWPRLACASLVAGAVALPWWAGALAGSGEAAPSEGVLTIFGRPERIWPSLALLGGVFVDYGATLGLATLSLIAIVAAFVTRATRAALFLSAFFAAFVITMSATIAAEPLLDFSRHPEVNPVERVALVCLIALIPLTSHAFSESLKRLQGLSPAYRTTEPGATPDARWRPLALWAVVGLGLLIYPMLVLLSHTGVSYP